MCGELEGDGPVVDPGDTPGETAGLIKEVRSLISERGSLSAQLALGAGYRVSNIDPGPRRGGSVSYVTLRSHCQSNVCSVGCDGGGKQSNTYNSWAVHHIKACSYKINSVTPSIIHTCIKRKCQIAGINQTRCLVAQQLNYLTLKRN